MSVMRWMTVQRLRKINISKNEAKERRGRTQTHTLHTLVEWLAEKPMGGGLGGLADLGGR